MFGSIRSLRRQVLAVQDWVARGYGSPAPAFIKRSVIKRYSSDDCTFVETGTHLGDTTAFAATFARTVVSIEPAELFYTRAVSRFSKCDRVSIIHDTSENALPKLLPTISGNVTFWLDGHWSGFPTYEGANHTPIVEELAAIARHLERLSDVTICVDDVRCFDPNQKHFEKYPPLSFLSDWARDHGMKWTIEHDIFVMRPAAL